MSSPALDSLSSRLAAARDARERLREDLRRELAHIRATVRRTSALVPELSNLISHNGMKAVARGRVGRDAPAAGPMVSGPRDTKSWDHLLRMERLFDVEEITLDIAQRAAAVRVTDGCISHLVWSNPDKSATHDLFVRVAAMIPEEVARVRGRIDALLDAGGLPE